MSWNDDAARFPRFPFQPRRRVWFQSTQFRQIEATLGLRMENRFGRITTSNTEIGGFNSADYQTIVEAEKGASLLRLVEQWLERMPFFGDAFWQGWDGEDADVTSTVNTQVLEAVSKAV